MRGRILGRRVAIGAACLVAVMGIGSAHAQVGLKDIEMPSTVGAAYGYFASGALWHHRDKVALPAQESKALSKQQAEQWLAKYDAGQVSELEMVPLASLLVSLKRDAEGLALYDRRLAMATLTTHERAYTLGRLIAQFADADNPSRMAIAKRYLPQLVALNDSAALVMYGAYKAVVQAHFAKGERDSVLVYSKAALELTPRVSFPERKDATFFSNPNELPMLVMYASAAAAEPDGKDKIQAMTEWVRSYTVAPQEIAAIDSMFAAKRTGSYQWQLKMSEFLISRLGTPARGLVATHWLNREAPTEVHQETGVGTSLALNDGKVRMMVFGNRSCGGCQAAAAEMKKMHPRLPASVELIYAINSQGYWGIDLIEPEQEVDSLRKHYVEHLGYQYPIAVWAGPKETTHDGGLVPQRTPNGQYFTGTPTIMITDARGIIRYYFQGFNPSMTDFFVSLLTGLANESRAHAMYPLSTLVSTR